MDLRDIMTMAPVIPVLVIEDVAHAQPLAAALVAGGLRVLEVTLRTPAALTAMTEMSRVPGAIVGAGTVLEPGQFDAAVAAGARFIVSPGLTERLASHARAAGVPFLPGAATASEVMRAREMGFNRLKFFPAEVSGGAPALKALAGPLGDVRFCPTGGVTAANRDSYLGLPNVDCVGGTWLAKPGETDWAAIEGRARAASVPCAL
jgi:2-dehydro-3-deoxyphosphogluconate aldolase/(4S)-4-hydroxy-2-oxoglutarate aldolase